jgi:hypothetical protein
MSNLEYVLHLKIAAIKCSTFSQILGLIPKGHFLSFMSTESQHIHTKEGHV